MTTPHKQLYLDCDGVLANFEKRALEILGMPPREYEKQNTGKTFWTRLYETPNFFTDLEPMPDAHDLVAAVKHLRPIILTGCPRGYWAMEQKHLWRDKHFPDLPMICLRSADKSVHCRPGDMLVDDWEEYKHHWIKKGGEWITHTSAADTIDQLKAKDWL
jgi:hypothetical protein